MPGIIAVSFYLMVMYGAIYKWQYTDKTLTLRRSMYMRASGASELRIFLHFCILKLLFLSIFCWYIRYFVGTNDMLVGSHVPTNFQNVPTKLRKGIIGGGGGPPPSGYANAVGILFHVIAKVLSWVEVGWPGRSVHSSDEFLLHVPANKEEELEFLHEFLQHAWLLRQEKTI